MIWHFFEVWALMLVAFAIGCPLGAAAYKLIAQSRLGNLQGDVADVVGDVVDGIKSRLGIGPVWRPEYRRLVERHGGDDMEDLGVLHGQGATLQDRLPAAERLPMITDQSAQSAQSERSLVGVIGGAAVADALATAAPGEARESVDSGLTAMARPVGLAAPRNGVPDDLQRIRGVGRRIEQRLNGIGIYHFGQIAAWTPAEMRWVAQQLAFPERIDRDDWIGQAIILAAGGETGFVKSADRRRARRREIAFSEMAEHEGDVGDLIDFDGDEGAEMEIAEGAIAGEDVAESNDGAGREGGDSTGAEGDDDAKAEAGDTGTAHDDDAEAEEKAT